MTGRLAAPPAPGDRERQRWGPLRLAAAAVVIGFLAASTPARANQVSTDSWGCSLVGDTWFSSGTQGWASTSGGSSCTYQTMVRLQWYCTCGSWYDSGYVYQSADWAQVGGSPSSSLLGSHQIFVTGHGGGQIVGTSQ